MIAEVIRIAQISNPVDHAVRSIRAKRCRPVRFSWYLRCWGGVMLLVVGLASAACGRVSRGSASLEELTQAVRSAHERTDVDGFFNLYYNADAPPELESALKEWVRNTWPKGSVVKSLKVLPFGEYEPESKLPGTYHGRPLKWVATPSHWILLQSEPPKQRESSLSTSNGAELPVFQKGHRWFIVGATYRD